MSAGGKGRRLDSEDEKRAPCNGNTHSKSTADHHGGPTADGRSTASLSTSATTTRRGSTGTELRSASPTKEHPVRTRILALGRHLEDRLGVLTTSSNFIDWVRDIARGRRGRGRGRENVSGAKRPLDEGSSAPTEEAPLLKGAEQPSYSSDHPFHDPTVESIPTSPSPSPPTFSNTTPWRQEALIITSYTAPLVLTLLLQYSLTVTSIFTLGHLGPIELGAASLASMSANITGYVVYGGLATGLDTLCAQAYGSGRKKLVGLQMQRMVMFLWVVTVPVGVQWIASPVIFRAVLPAEEPGTAELAGLYLRVVLLGAPGVAAFQCGMHFVQAQGLFLASLYVLLVCAPFNALLSWLFVWRLGWGFIGAPVAVAITQTLLPILLALYVRCVDGWQCWPGFSSHAWRNWGPMVRLAVPGLVMVEAECLAFEVLTLASSYLGTTALAAQSVVATVVTTMFYPSFSLSIAMSTRIANLIGAGHARGARRAARTGLTLAVCLALFDFIVLLSARKFIPRMFSSDPEVWRAVERVLPICTAFQLFDAVAADSNGILRGLGRQKIGGYVNLFCYYVVAMPISMGTTFRAGWGLSGLWSGVAIALAM